MSLSCIILAAGSGTRMRSSLPKVLHPVLGRPMLQYVVDAVAGLKPDRTIIVLGENHDLIKEKIDIPSGVEFSIQRRPLGTADAFKCGLKGVRGTAICLNGDMPLIGTDMLRKLLRLHRRHRNSLSIASFMTENPSSYGRIIRDSRGRAKEIVEALDAPKLSGKAEVNAGLYVVEPEAYRLLERIKKNKKKGEYYITDLLRLAVENGLKAEAYRIGSEEDFIGVNTKEELSKAELTLRRKIISYLTEKGVVFIDPESTYILPGVEIGKDTLIYPNVFIEGKTKIGRNCKIFPNTRIISSTIGEGSLIKDSSVIENSLVGKGVQIGPFAHIRPESIIRDRAKIGNFVEIKKSSIGVGTKAMHLSYIGDAEVGTSVNIGAGTITCNYDGAKKHKTKIEDGVFIGSASQLVAPVRIKRGAYIGAGSTITSDVPEDALAISRCKQKNIEGWAKKKRK